MSRLDPPPTLDSLASLREDGSRRYVYPADVAGRLTSTRRVVFTLLVVVLVGTPWVRLGGRPAVLLDVPRRQFFLLGEAYNAQDGALVFFLLTGLGFALLMTTTLFGRLWCGFACPQTVFVEGVYRAIERLVEGPAQARIRLDRSAASLAKVARKVVKHVAYAVVSMLIAHAVLGYFVPVREMWSVVRSGPSQHLEAFAWTMAIAAVVYFDFGWFREQFCVVMCPYGRLQSVLTDRDTVVVGYDARRGEPRGKLKVLGNGDCIDCGRCVAVCPTGIDIRQGLQLDCVGCGACVDACDEVMRKIDKPTGLVRLDSQEGFDGGKTRLVRPRTLVYAVAGLVGVAALAFTLSRRTPFEATVLRPARAPYAVEGGEVRNVLRLHLVNKRAEPMTLRLSAQPVSGVTFVVPQPEVTLAPHAHAEVPVIASMPVAAFAGPFSLQLDVARDGGVQQVVSRFVGPGRLAPTLAGVGDRIPQREARLERLARRRRGLALAIG